MSPDSGSDLTFAQAMPSEIVGEQPLVVMVCGWITINSEPVESIVLEVDGESLSTLILDQHVPPKLWLSKNRATSYAGLEPDTSYQGFSGFVQLPGRETGHRHIVRIGIVDRATADTRWSEHLIDRIGVECANPMQRGLEPHVAICMGVYNPDEPVFARQIDSIVAQTEQNWICIVNDDGSDSKHVEIIHRVIGNDKRFFYFRNSDNQGFYGNFERAIARVPEGIEYIALSDQDDYWYADKIKTLLTAMSDDVLLAYSDMRIVASSGVEIEPSYWGYRKNNSSDLALMLVANTVTGAACMMRSRLARHLLPFPPRVGDAFHDHWISCSALAMGRINYIDQPLYDYYQYGDNIIGHCAFEQNTTSKDYIEKNSNPLHYLNPVNVKSLAARFMGSGQAVYWFECRRIESICNNINVRVHPDNSVCKIFNLFGRGILSAMALTVLNLKHFDSARRTNNAERRLARAYLVRSLLGLSHKNSATHITSSSASSL
ncbi:MAG: hypothetical protein DHS20C01_15650 [marine bacterium B5-7]|nr:MAG: hypothetical protein DHS20C01_15650 [marine bacterium B5-7]